MTIDEAKDILQAVDLDLSPVPSPRLDQALELMQGNVELKHWFEAERAFDRKITACFKEIPVPSSHFLTAAPPSPPTSAEQEKATGKNAPIQIRRRLLIGSLFTAGLAAIVYRWQFPKAVYQGDTSPISQSRPATATDLRNYVTTFVANGFSLDYYTDSPAEAQAWLADQQTPTGQLGDVLANLESMGCKVIPWRGTDLSLLCFQDKEGHYIHLFRIGNDLCQGSEGSLKNPSRQYNPELSRETLLWEHDQCICVLVPHKRGQVLPESLA